MTRRATPWGTHRGTHRRARARSSGALGLAVPALAFFLVSRQASAGPPYITDDPEPVELHHWELYLASQSFHDRDGWTLTAPHFEVNYGAVPDLQLHLIAPLAYSAPVHGPSAYGYGDTELGVKLRFIEERVKPDRLGWIPMIGTFPLLEVPSGSQQRGLGNGSAQAFFPVWLQKSVGPWQTYGGVGPWIDLGNRQRHWWYFGWLVQRRMFEWLSLGAEVFHQTPMGPGQKADSRFNVGAVLDITELHHVLLSAGRGFEGSNLFQSYLAYQLTFGP